MFKKVLALGMTFAFAAVTAFGGIQPANAAEIKKSECVSCTGDTQQVIKDALKQLEADGTKTNLQISSNEKTELNNIIQEKDKEYANALKLLKKDGFKVETKANNYITFENLKDENVTYEKVGVVTEFSIKNSKEIVKKQVWVDLKEKQVVRYDVVKIQDNGSSEPTITKIANYDVKEKIATENGTQDGFKFNGISFACSVSGVLACAAATGGLAVYFPYVGAAVSLACVMAFNTGCSFT